MTTLFTVITYRPNKLVTSLGYIQEAHDSSLSIDIFKDEDDVESFLVQEHLKDLRRHAAEPWNTLNEYKFLVNGSLCVQLFEPVLFDAKMEAERQFDLETKAKRAKEAREQAEREARELAAKRSRDISDLKRILGTYSVQELRDELGEFRL